MEREGVEKVRVCELMIEVQRMGIRGRKAENLEKRGWSKTAEEMPKAPLGEGLA